jgi:ribosomal 30S subunit maturation factor RimM
MRTKPVQQVSGELALRPSAGAVEELQRKQSEVQLKQSEEWEKQSEEWEKQLVQVQARLEEMSRENEQGKQKNLALLESAEEAREEV